MDFCHIFNKVVTTHIDSAVYMSKQHIKCSTHSLPGYGCIDFQYPLSQSLVISGVVWVQINVEYAPVLLFSRCSVGTGACYNEPEAHGAHWGVKRMDAIWKPDADWKLDYRVMALIWKGIWGKEIKINCLWRTLAGRAGIWCEDRVLVIVHAERRVFLAWDDTATSNLGM